MDTTTIRPNCDYLVSSNDVGVVDIVAVKIVTRCIDPVDAEEIVLRDPEGLILCNCDTSTEV